MLRQAHLRSQLSHKKAMSTKYFSRKIPFRFLHYRFRISALSFNLTALMCRKIINLKLE